MHTLFLKPVGKGSFMIQKAKQTNKQKTLQLSQTQTKNPDIYQHMYSHNENYHKMYNLFFLRKLTAPF